MLVTLHSYRDPASAEVAKNRLESEGIRATIFDDGLITMVWLYSRAIGGAKLKVEAADLERAREVLREDRSGDLDRISDVLPAPDASESCPRCGSPDLRPSRVQRNLAAFTLLTGIPLLFFRRSWVCDDCGHAWKAPDRREEAAPETIAAEEQVRESRSYPIKRVLFAVFLGLAILRYVEYQIRGY